MEISEEKAEELREEAIEIFNKKQIKELERQLDLKQENGNENNFLLDPHEDSSTIEVIVQLTDDIIASGTKHWQLKSSIFIVTKQQLTEILKQSSHISDKLLDRDKVIEDTICISEIALFLKFKLKK